MLQLLILTAILFLPNPTACSDVPARQNVTFPPRVFPGMTSFPSNEELLATVLNLTGDYVYPTHPDYIKAATVYNGRLQRFPVFIVNVKTVEDIQKVISFTTKHNLMLVVRSSGHSFIGRSTHHGSVVINMQNMKGRRFNLDSERSAAGEATLESGNSWLEVYREVDTLVTYDAEGRAERRVIVGGSAHTVAMGGYTLGGGHSPFGKQLGLAVDNLLEATVVLADGRKAVVNENGTTITDLSGDTTHTNDSSLFWALRGGGGGTFGVVVDFTFKLHFAPQRFRHVVVSWALYYNGSAIGNDTMKQVIDQLGRMSPNWGGYLITSGVPISEDATGYLLLSLNHFGSDDSPSNSEVDFILNNITLGQYYKNDTRYETFLEYELTAVDPTSTYSYIFNTFVQKDIVDDDEQLTKLVTFLMDLKNVPSAQSSMSCTGTMVGGVMGNMSREATPINPKFRSGLFSMTCGIAWSDIVVRDDFYVDFALQMRDKLSSLGEGSYFNEPAEDMDDWKTQFWGDLTTYDRLLQVKQTWDPNHVFWCRNCVGSDLFANTPIPTTTMDSTDGQRPTSGGGRKSLDMAGMYFLLAVVVWVLSPFE